MTIETTAILYVLRSSDHTLIDELTAHYLEDGWYAYDEQDGPAYDAVDLGTPAETLADLVDELTESYAQADKEVVIRATHYRAAYVGAARLTGPEHAHLDDEDLIDEAMAEAGPGRGALIGPADEGGISREDIKIADEWSD